MWVEERKRGLKKGKESPRQSQTAQENPREPQKVEDSPRRSKRVPGSPRESHREFQTVQESPTERVQNYSGYNLFKVQANTRCKTLPGFNLMHVWCSGFYIKDLGAAWA